MKTKIYIIVSSLITLWCAFFCFCGYIDCFNVSVVKPPEVVETPVVNKPTIIVPISPVPTEDPKHTEVFETISITGENRNTIAIMIAKTMYGEGRGIASITEQACVAWTILNRVDAGYGSIFAIITSPNQFCYSEEFPTVDDYDRDLVNLALDVIERWEKEHDGEINVGRVLPSEYLWFGGEKGHNWFRDDYRKFDNIWDYSLPSPYES
jgi:hypothetical protein